MLFEFYIVFRFVLVKFLQDTIVQPIDTEWFQFYVPNQDKQIQAFSESNAAVSIIAIKINVIEKEND